MPRSTGRSRSEPEGDEAVEAHGWTLLAHPCFLDQLENLVATVEEELSRGRDQAHSSANQQLLAAIVHLAFDEIPRDPSRKEFRQGNTLGSSRKHWFRAKFGAGRFRLFFRYRSDLKIILYAWVNDATTLRTYGSRTDAYAIFAKMLDAGKVPDDWDSLVKASRKSLRRLGSLRRERK